MCGVQIFRQISITRVQPSQCAMHVRQLNCLRARKVLFSWYDLEMKFTVPARVGWFIFERDRDR